MWVGPLFATAMAGRMVHRLHERPVAAMCGGMYSTAMHQRRADNHPQDEQKCPTSAEGGLDPGDRATHAAKMRSARRPVKSSTSRNLRTQRGTNRRAGGLHWDMTRGGIALKTCATVPFGLFLFATGVVTGLCLRPRPAARFLQPGEPEGADYLHEAAAIDLFQIEAGKLAQARASDPDVQAYAGKMAKHHRRALLQMRQAARQGGFNVDGLPALTGQYQELLSALRSAPDYLFNSVYLRVQAQLHQAAVELHQGVGIVALSQAAQDVATMMADHLTEVEALIERRRPGSMPERSKAAAPPQPRPAGQPQTPNQTPGDGSSAPFMN